MGSTTLVTFLMETPHSTSTVELLGSWDNFTRAYPLERDLRMGRGHWRGCYTFTDIIYDGDTKRFCQKRNGGLKMGGTYWYFYRLDGDIDFCNRTQPSTTLCPLFPGQKVNVLEVPTDAATTKGVRPNESSGSINSAVFTLDPQHKYLTPKPPPRKAVMTDDCATTRKDISIQVCAQLLGMVKYGANRANKSFQDLPQAASTPSAETSKERIRKPGLAFRQSSLMAVFHRLRGTRSAEYRRESTTANSFLHHGKASGSTSRILKPFQRSTKSADGGRSTSNMPPSRAPAEAVIARDPLAARQISPQKVFPDSYVHTRQPDPVPSKLNIAPPNTPTPSTNETSGSEIGSPSQDEAKWPSGPLSIPKSDIAPSEVWSPCDCRICQPPDKRDLRVSTDFDGRTRSSQNIDQTLPNAGGYTRHSSLDELRDGFYSPGLGVITSRSGSSSPSYLSEPESPIPPNLDRQQISTKDGSLPGGAPEDHDYPPWHTRTMTDGRYDDARSLDKPSPQPFFAGYSLPQSEHASASTIKQPQLNPFQNLNSNPFHNSNDGNNIQVLDNSPTFRMTALEELVDDLGYLGQAII